MLEMVFSVMVTRLKALSDSMQHRHKMGWNATTNSFHM